MYKRGDRQKEAIQNVSKLSVYASRDVEELKSRNDLVIYLSGDLCKKVEKAFEQYRKDAKEMKKAQEAQSSKTESEDQGTVMAQAAQGLNLVDKTWKVVFTEHVLEWCKSELERIATSGDLPSKLAKAPGILAEMSPEVLATAVVNQRFHTEKAVQGKAWAWASGLALDGGSSGRLLYQALKHELRPLYTKGGQLGVGLPGSGKDRQLTREVAEFADMPVRDGKKKGESASSRSGKRTSPDPDRRGKKTR